MERDNEAGNEARPNCAQQLDSAAPYHRKCRSPELIAIGDKVLIPDSICYRGILLYCLSVSSFIVKEDVVSWPSVFSLLHDHCSDRV